MGVPSLQTSLSIPAFFKSSFLKSFVADLIFFGGHRGSRPLRRVRDRPIIDHLFEPHHHPHVWRLAWYRFGGLPLALRDCGIGDQLCAEKELYTTRQDCRSRFRIDCSCGSTMPALADVLSAESFGRSATTI